MYQSIRNHRRRTHLPPVVMFESVVISIVVAVLTVFVVVVGRVTRYLVVGLLGEVVPIYLN